MSRKRVAVFSLGAIGHVNPLLAVVSALAGREDVAEVLVLAPGSVVGTYELAGARGVRLDFPPVDAKIVEESAGAHLFAAGFLSPLHVADQAIDQLKALGADVVLYDVFSVLGFLAARVCGLPSAAFLTFPGYGALDAEFEQAHANLHPALLQVNRQIRLRFGIDLISEVPLPVVFPSSDLSIVACTARQARRPAWRDPQRMSQLTAAASRAEYVGPCLGPVRVRPTNWTSNRREIALFRGKYDQIVLFSLGTNLSDFRKAMPLGGAPTGEEFVTSLTHRFAEALRGAPELGAVVKVDRPPGAETENWPPNLLPCGFVEQRWILEHGAAVFVTHHGWNSTMEALLASVPMVSLPGVGEQVATARAAIDWGVAVAKWDVADCFNTCTPRLLLDAIREAASNPGIRQRCREESRSLRSCSGAGRAAQCIVDLACRG